MMNKIYQYYSEADFNTILGTFETCGPIVYSSLKWPLFVQQGILGELDISDLMKKGRDEFIKQTTLNIKDKNTFYFSFLGMESKSEKINITSIDENNNLDQQNYELNTFAHEIHHFLNLCSCPFGFLIHSNKVLLNKSFQFFSNEANKNDWYFKLKFPLVSNVTYNNKEAKDIQLLDFFHKRINNFLQVQRSFLGEIEVDINVYKDPFEEINGGHVPLMNWYGFIDLQFNTNLKSHFKSVKNHPTGPLVGLKSNKKICELGGIQIIECIANLCEALWLIKIKGSFFSKKFEKELPLDKVEYRKILRKRLDEKLNNCLFSKDHNFSKRYRVPLIIVQSKFKNKDINSIIFDTLFICWMSLMTPIDPRTIHLIEKFELQWDDIHPGYRFLQILEVMVENDLSIGHLEFESRKEIDRFYNEFSKILGWPDFEEILESIKKPHKCESFFEAMALNKVIPYDPFFEIYGQINRKREKAPWCDIIPGDEYITSNHIYIPLIIQGNILNISSEKCGLNGFGIASMSKVADFFIFGYKDPALKLFLSNRFEDIFDQSHKLLFNWDIESFKNKMI